jgi:hypothetical protein
MTCTVLSVCRNCFTEILFVFCCSVQRLPQRWLISFIFWTTGECNKTNYRRALSLAHAQALTWRGALCSCLLIFFRAETGCKISGSRGACGMLRLVYWHIVAGDAKGCSTFIFGVREPKALRCLTLKLRAPLSTV